MKTPAFTFTKLPSAWSFANACIKMHVVIQGDLGKFWVVTLAEAGRLMKAGYEPAPRF